MKITKEQLKKLIKESVDAALDEASSQWGENPGSDELERRQRLGIKARPGLSVDDKNLKDRYAQADAQRAQQNADWAKDLQTSKDRDRQRAVDQDAAAGAEYAEDERRAAIKRQRQQKKDKSIGGRIKKAGQAVAGGVKKIFGKEEIARMVREEIKKLLA